jgi:hypothetical protein
VRADLATRRRHDFAQDDEAAKRFRIVVDVRNSAWGSLFGYRGSFDVEWRAVTAGDPPNQLADVPALEVERDDVAAAALPRRLDPSRRAYRSSGTRWSTCCLS